MSHEGGPEQPQRTVAELLAKYGAESGERAPRRRRRRADDVSDTGAQAIIDRVLSESGEMQAIRDDMPPPERTSHRRGTSTGQFPRPQQPPPPEPPPRRQPPQPSQQLPRPLPPQPPPPSQPLPSQPPPRPVPQPGQQSSNHLPAMARPAEPTTPVRGAPRPVPGPDRQPPRPQPSQRVPLPPPQGGTRERSGIQPSLRSRLDAPDVAPPPPPPPMPVAPPEPTTEELPRVPGRIPVDGSMTGRRPIPGADSRTRISPPAYPPPHDPYADPPAEDEDYRSPYPAADQDDRYDSAEYDVLVDEDADDRDFDRDLDELADDDLDDLDDDDDRVRSPAKEWAIMGGQLALGVIGGAGIWLGFNWLWGFMPQAALVAALAVIVGLVLIVRKIRRAEDLQTTFLAVLVGLVVTVSPAALLLLNK
ncbi:hypothetical protein [Actinophytocola glycyrrhizae]|uniref:Uncharacterized protein n=1 Tax=Actinophytocola glycyrrhizae TaxID=2044873 RepID=A0ABV9RUR7_9PSEU